MTCQKKLANKFANPYSSHTRLGVAVMHSGKFEYVQITIGEV